MKILIFFALVTFMSILARAAGGGMYAEKMPKPAPEIVFGFGMALPVFYHTGEIWLWLAAAAWSYAWMETGHGIAYHMGRLPNQPPSRRQKLSIVMDWLEPRLGLSRYSRPWRLS